jgi:16S rRNA (guanine966-N2)-methyltransferase
VVVVDPPYDLAQGELVAVLDRLTVAGALAAHADVIVERGVKAGEPVWPDPLIGIRVRRYGDTLLCYGRAP